MGKTFKRNNEYSRKWEKVKPKKHKEKRREEKREE
jgi:hypothetical protein